MQLVDVNVIHLLVLCKDQCIFLGQIAMNIKNILEHSCVYPINYELLFILKKHVHKTQKS